MYTHIHIQISEGLNDRNYSDNKPERRSRKTTTALALGAGLSLKGFKVLFIDMDAQANLTYTIGADHSGLTTIDLLTKTIKQSK